MLKRLEQANSESDEVAKALHEERVKIDVKLATKDHEIREWALK